MNPINQFALDEHVLESATHPSYHTQQSWAKSSAVTSELSVNGRASVPDGGSSSAADAKRSRKTSDSRSRKERWTLNNVFPALQPPHSDQPDDLWIGRDKTYQERDAAIAYIVVWVVGNSTESASHVC